MKDPDKIGSVLVVGAGIGGMQASLDLANSGFKVYLVERNSAIGGIMSQLDKTFPTNDCAMCTMAPRLVEIGRHKDIEIITLTDVESIQGVPGNFNVRLRKKARYIDENKCTGCRDCEEKCPIEIPSDYNVNLNNMKAIYRLYPQAVPNSFAIQKLGRSPCSFNCPVQQKVQGYIALIRQKRYEDAYNVIMRDNPFPSVCGRVCNHRCEDECTRKQVDAPVSAMALKRFVADWAYDHKISNSMAGDESTRKISDKHIAIIGSGPAGLTAAFDLRMEGHQVSVFETLPFAGGMMRVGIPEYRLPRERLEWDIENILSCGIEIKTGNRVESLTELLENGFDAVFIATGTHKGYTLDITGIESDGVLDGLDFLKRINIGQEVELGQKVIVVGGGNTAIDAARTIKRLGKEITILYRRTRHEMPAQAGEIEEALAEGVNIQYLSLPVKIIAENSKMISAACIKMQLGDADASGRRRPVPIEGSDFSLDADNLILAIGQGSDLPFAEDGLKLTKRGTIDVDPETLATSIPGVFAGGDVIGGSAFVIEAIADGHTAALSMDQYLKGKPFQNTRTIPRKVELSIAEIRENIKSKESRHNISVVPVAERFLTTEVQLGYSEEQALAEAERCLNCGICSECFLCEEACMAGAVDHTMLQESFEDINVGAVILSPGYKLMCANTKLEYGYWQYPNVVTSLQFERILSASGPFMGKVLSPSNKKPPKSIAFLQCVASRENKRDYCSSVCCMYATKESIIAKEHINGDLICDIYYMDIRAFGKGFEEYFERAKAMGVNYIRCRPSAVKEIDDHRLSIQYLDEYSKIVIREYDLVVLSMGMAPHEEVNSLSGKIGIDTDEYGFCRTDPFNPTKSSREGIYVCGPYTEPKDIPETVTQASGAAAHVQALLHEVRGSLIEPREFPPEKDVTGQVPRIGVFVCHCGSNIAGVVNIPDVIEYVRSLPGVVYADDNLYTCSNDTQKKIRETIEEYEINRVIVASCTPRTHEPLFRNTLREAGLNPYLFEMANIRDQCSWVHMENHEKATLKAKELIYMAVSKSRYLEPLYSISLPIHKDALVLGGGIGGMTAALGLADQGFKVHLIEKNNYLGGNMKDVHYILGVADPQERLRKVIKRTAEHLNIKVWLNTRIAEVEGFVGNFKTVVEQNGENSEIEHGVVIVATGGRQYTPDEYMYGSDKRIITQCELEKKIAENHFSEKRIVMIQCVGSREENRMYCSRICCSQAVKNSIKIKEKFPDTQVYILYRELRTYGFREKYYSKARQMGIKFVRYSIDSKPDVSVDGDKLQINLDDLILGKNLQIDCDLLVLAPAVVPREDAEDIARMLKIPLTKYKFFLEAHMKLRPVDFAAEGIFLAGMAHSPKNVDETIAQAEAAAGRAAVILSKSEYTPEAIISSADEDLCAGCGICASICSYDASKIVKIRNRKVAIFNTALCKGCGACAAACPSGAVQQLGFRPKQVANMISAALEI